VKSGCCDWNCQHIGFFGEYLTQQQMKLNQEMKEKTKENCRRKGEQGG
jgi:hypothetical protein